MDLTANWRKSFFTIYIGQAFSILSSSAVQFSIIWWITMETWLRHGIDNCKCHRLAAASCYWFVLLPLMVKGYFNGTAWHNGIVQTLFSSGMLIAAMVIGITGGLKKQFLMISISTGLLGICAFIGGVLPANLFWVFCIVVFIMGTTGMGFNIPFTSYMQRTVPAENLGKVISLVTSVMSFAAPVGMFIAGPVSEIIGVSNWMVCAGMKVVHLLPVIITDLNCTKTSYLLSTLVIQFYHQF